MVSERGNTQEQKRRNKRQSVVICIPGIQPRHLPNLLSLSLSSPPFFFEPLTLYGGEGEGDDVAT